MLLIGFFEGIGIACRCADSPALRPATGAVETEERTAMDTNLPPHLADKPEALRENPRGSAVQWFRQARFGLFIHYGLYSQLGRGEWVQLRERIPVAEYASLKDSFDPSGFDADAIARLAVRAGMEYITVTTRHHDSFCLFETSQTDFNSVDACGRDLMAELAEACAAQGLGLFWYYSYAADWRHPYFYTREAGLRGEAHFAAARPDYDHPQPEYRFEKDEDFARYIDFAHAQIRELLTQYGPVAGMWFDPIMGYYARPDLFPIEQTYALVRELQPHALIGFKQGANGDEDFTAPERTPAAHRCNCEVSRAAWQRNTGKPIEICDTLQAGAWGHNAEEDGQHKGPEDVMALLDHASEIGANLLLNTGPLADGSIPKEDVETLLEVGRRLSGQR